MMLEELIKNKQYVEATQLIRENHNIDLNVKDGKQQTFLVKLLTNPTYSSELIQLIDTLLTDPRFTVAQDASVFNDTACDLAVQSFDPRILRTFIKHEKKIGLENIVLKKFDQTMQYESLLEILNMEKVELDECGVDERAEKEADIQTHTEMLAMLHDVTRLYALQKDDPSILQRLEKAGAFVASPMENGVLFFNLVREQNKTNILAWANKPLMPTQLANKGQALTKSMEQVNLLNAQAIDVQSEALQSRLGLFSGFIKEVGTTLGQPLSALARAG